jgi:hypothetical protein
MKIRQKSIGGPVIWMMVLCLGIVIATGCNSETTQPKPEVAAMGGILVPNGTPAGTPCQAGVVVTVDGQVVTDAVVQINGIDLVYVDDPEAPETSGYIGMVPVSQGDLLTLSYSAAGESGTHQATVPGMVEIQSPTPGAAFANDDDILLSWTPSTGAVYTVVTCGNEVIEDPGMWMLGKDASSITIPADYTAAPGCRLTVISANGSGSLPVSMDLRDWVGLSGFWASCQDFVDVVVTN